MHALKVYNYPIIKYLNHLWIIAIAIIYIFLMFRSKQQQRKNGGSSMSDPYFTRRFSDHFNIEAE